MLSPRGYTVEPPAFDFSGNSRGSPNGQEWRPHLELDSMGDLAKAVRRAVRAIFDIKLVPPELGKYNRNRHI
jgi:hypothetical protein